LIASLCLPLGLHAEKAAPLHLLTEEFPPINYLDQGKVKGLSVDVVNEIQRRLGRKDPIELMPWTRAYREIQTSQRTALFAMARTPAREALFKWVGPIMISYAALYAPARGGIRLHSLDEAKKVESILVVRDWYTSEQLTSRGFANLQPVADPASALRMLLAGRATLFAIERLGMPDILAQQGIAESSIEAVFTYASSEGYIAFSKDMPDAEIEQWNAALRDMKRDGSFKRIYKRWLPNDNPPIAPNAP